MLVHVKMKISSKGQSVIYAKICTIENFPLYGIKKLYDSLYFWQEMMLTDHFHTSRLLHNLKQHQPQHRWWWQV